MKSTCESCTDHKAKQTVNDGTRKGLHVCNPCARIIQEKKRRAR